MPTAVTEDIDKFNTIKLMGSRSMSLRPDTDTFSPRNQIGNYISYSTDWDFSIPYSKTNCDLLTKLGYTLFEKGNLTYADNLTEVVAEKTYSPKFDINNPIAYCCDDVTKVHIVLRNDYALFCNVWESISAEFYYRYLWKSSVINFGVDAGELRYRIRDIMNQLYDTAKGMI